MKKVICIGSAAKDIFVVLNSTEIKENKKSLTEKKVMSFEFGAKIDAESLVEELGGSAVNVAAGLTKGGYRSFVFARTRKDEVGKWIQKQIGKLKIKKNYMQARGIESNAVSAIISDKEHLDHTIIRTGDSTGWFDLDKALNKFREKVDWVYVASLKKDSPEKIDKILSFADKKKAKICFVPSGYQIKNYIKDLVGYFEKFEIIFLNRDEAIEMLQSLGIEFKDDPQEILMKIKKLGAKVVALTDGADGAYVTDGKDSFHLGITDSDKQETVGAGDSFASGFLNTYIEEENIKKGLAWGIVNSGSVLTQVGATKGLLNKKELKKQGGIYIKKIKKLK